MSREEPLAGWETCDTEASPRSPAFERTDPASRGTCRSAERSAELRTRESRRRRRRGHGPPVCRRDTGRSTDWSSRPSATGPSPRSRTCRARSSRTTGQMIASGRVDAVVIATPHWSHPEVAIDALNRGLHVLTDKPLAVHVADGRRMLAAHTGQDAPLRCHLQRANAPGERQDPVHDPGRGARGAAPRHLARHGPLSLARLLRERRLAGDLGRARAGAC